MRGRCPAVHAVRPADTAPRPTRSSGLNTRWAECGETPTNGLAASLDPSFSRPPHGPRKAHGSAGCDRAITHSRNFAAWRHNPAFVTSGHGISRRAGQACRPWGIHSVVQVADMQRESGLCPRLARVLQRCSTNPVAPRPGCSTNPATHRSWTRPITKGSVNHANSFR